MSPMVNNSKEAKNIVNFSKYPPLGKRGAGLVLHIMILKNKSRISN